MSNEKTFTKENFDKLKDSCQKIERICDDADFDGDLSLMELIYFGELIKDFVGNPIVCKSGILECTVKTI